MQGLGFYISWALAGWLLDTLRKLLHHLTTE